MASITLLRSASLSPCSESDTINKAPFIGPFVMLISDFLFEELKESVEWRLCDVELEINAKILVPS